MGQELLKHRGEVGEVGHRAVVEVLRLKEEEAAAGARRHFLRTAG